MKANKALIQNKVKNGRSFLVVLYITIYQSYDKILKPSELAFMNNTLGEELILLSSSFA